MFPLKRLIKSTTNIGENKVLPYRKNMSNKFEKMVREYFCHTSMTEWSKEKLSDSWSFYRNRMINGFDTEILNTDNVDIEPEDNIPENKDIFIYQLYGSQEYPDFLILRRTGHKLYIIKLELKSSKNWKSTWNCGLPRPFPGCIYIHYNTSKKLMFPFFGKDLITVEEYKKLYDDVNPYRNLLKENGSENFSTYLRPMFNQLNNYNIKYLESSIKEISSYLDLINKDYKPQIIFEDE